MNARQEKQYRESPEILKKAILSMRKKIIDNEQEFQNAPLRVWVENANGIEVPKPNPFVQEYRALVRDFSAALKAYKEIAGEKETEEVSSLENIRSIFKVAK